MFPNFDEKGAITSLEDESTVDPYESYRDGKMPWENLPWDSTGAVLEEFWKYVPPIKIKKDNWPKKQSKNSWDGDMIIKMNSSSLDEFYIPSGSD